jgi:simple sugar transport system permease protein
MKFWNLGGNGQILMGCLADVAVMFYLGGKLPDILVMIIGVLAGVIAGAVWALIPAIFKAFFDTNESLFTLMMNYIASGLVAMFITIWVKTGSGVLAPLNKGVIPEIGNRYLLTVLVFFILAGLMYAYIKYSKQGYEISVVGESINTAKYVGINVRRVIIRTMIISGAIAGLVGAFIGGAIDHTVSTTSASNNGFTAIMTAWLAAFNPLVMIASCFFITFVSKGMTQVRKDFKFTNDAISNIVIGIIYFTVIAVTFFLSYKIVFRDGAFDGIKRLFSKKAKTDNNEEEVS